MPHTRARSCAKRDAICENPHLVQYGDNDTMYHYGLNTKQHDLKNMFGKVNVVITAGSQSRIKSFARSLHDKYTTKSQRLQLTQPFDYAADAGRFSLYCIENVLLFSHGMGSGSASIAFHEILKLLDYAGVQRDDFAFIRIGTCGGVGIKPGTLCLSTRSLTETLEEDFKFVECGKLIPMPMKLDNDLRHDLEKIAKRLGIDHISCKTLGTNDFYLGQGRLDGAFCSYGETERFEFLEKLHSLGVRNIEMESHTFSAFCTRANIKGAVMCVALLNRLGKGKENDQITADMETMSGWMDRAMIVLKEFIDSRRV